MSAWARSLALLACMVSGSAGAESLQCGAGSVAEGDSPSAVIQKCGYPQTQEQACVPVEVRQPNSPWSPLRPGATLCVPTQDWGYDRGPGNLAVTVRFQNGTVRSIHYGLAH